MKMQRLDGRRGLKGMYARLHSDISGVDHHTSQKALGMAPGLRVTSVPIDVASDPSFSPDACQSFDSRAHGYAVLA